MTVGKAHSTVEWRPFSRALDTEGCDKGKSRPATRTCGLSRVLQDPGLRYVPSILPTYVLK